MLATWLSLIFAFITLISFSSYSIFAESDQQVNELFKKGINSVKDGEFNDALLYFEKVLEIDPNHLDALSNKGGMLLQLGRYDEALTHLDIVLEIEPNHIGALSNKGAVLIKLERYEEAIPYLDRVFDINPNHTYALNLKGQALAKLERYEEALLYMDKLLEINPDHVVALGSKMQVMIRLGNMEEANQYFQRILEIQPRFASNLLKDPSTALVYKKLDGMLEIKIHDLEGHLIAYLKTTKLKVLVNDIIQEKIDNWPVTEIVTRNGAEYEVLKHNRTMFVEKYNIAGHTGISFSLEVDSDDAYTTVAGISKNIWAVLGNHPQYIIEKGDVVSHVYTIFRPVD